MVSSLAFAMYLLLAKPMIRRLGPSMFTSFAMIGAAIATFIQFALIHRLGDFHMSPALWGLGLGLAIGATVMPSYLTNFALSLISSQANAVISFINPVFTSGAQRLVAEGKDHGRRHHRHRVGHCRRRALHPPRPASITRNTLTSVSCSFAGRAILKT